MRKALLLTVCQIIYCLATSNTASAAGGQPTYVISINGDAPSSVCLDNSTPPLTITIAEDGEPAKGYFKSGDIIYIEFPGNFELTSTPRYSVGASSDLLDPTLLETNISTNSIAIEITTNDPGTSEIDALTIDNIVLNAIGTGTGKITATLYHDGSFLTPNEIHTITASGPYIYTTLLSSEITFAPGDSFQISINKPTDATVNDPVISVNGSINNSAASVTPNADQTIYTVSGLSTAGNYSIAFTASEDGCSSDAKSVSFSVNIPSIFKTDSIDGNAILSTYCEDNEPIKVYFDPSQIQSSDVTGTYVLVNGTPVNVIGDGNNSTEAYFTLDPADYNSEELYIEAYRTFNVSTIDPGECSNQCSIEYNECRSGCYDAYPPLYPIEPDPIDPYPIDPRDPIFLEPLTVGQNMVMPFPDILKKEAYVTSSEDLNLTKRQACYSRCETSKTTCVDNCNSASSTESRKTKTHIIYVATQPTLTISFDNEYCNTNDDIDVSTLISSQGSSNLLIYQGGTDVTSTAISGDLFRPSRLEPGDYTAYLVYNDGACISQVEHDFTITTSPDFQLSVVEDTGISPLTGYAVCETEAPFILMENDGADNLTDPDIGNISLTYGADVLNLTGIISVDGSGQVTVDPTQLDPGFTYTISYTKVSGTCVATNNFQFTINPNPTPFFTGLGREYCEADNSRVELKLNPEPANNVFALEVLDSTGLNVAESLPVITYDPTQQDYYFEPYSLPAGNYRVRYAFTSGSTGCTGEFLSDPVTIYTAPDTTYTVENLCLTQTTVFTATEPEAADSSTVYVWEFGDGTVQRGRRVEKVFNTAGQKAVTFTITNAGGCTFTSKENIHIYPLPKTAFTSHGFCLNTPTTFDATEAANADASNDAYEIKQYIWDFGDGSTDTLLAGTPVIEHTYASTGPKTVSLIIETENGCSEEITKEIFIFPVISAELYREAFETGFSAETNGWLDQSLDSLGLSSWTLQNVDSVGMAWTTRGNGGTYHNNEQSYIESACIDMSAYEDPQINLYYKCDTDEGNDGASLLYSVDGGITWHLLGEVAGGVEWYNTSNLLGQPGGEIVNEIRTGWSGQTGWTVAKYALAGVMQEALATNNLVRFRVAFGSNTDNPVDVDFGGFSLDEVRIFNKNKLVLLEHFTNLMDGSVKTERMSVSDYAEGRNDVVKIQYHIPDPVEDAIYQAHNPQVHGVPWLNYGISGPGVTVLEGRYNTPVKFMEGWGAPATTYHSLESTPFELETTYNGGRNGDPLQIAVNIVYNGTEINGDTIINQPLSLKTAVVIESLDESGETMRKVFYDFVTPPTGIYLQGAWEPGVTRTDEVSMEWAPPSTAAASTYSLVSWLQFKNIQYYDEYNHPIRPVLQSAYMPVGQPLDATRVTGIADDLEAGDIGLYPNPAHDMVALSFPYPTMADYTVTLIDLTGKTHERLTVPRGSRTLELQTGLIPRGLYLVRISDESGQQVIKKLLLR